MVTHRNIQRVGGEPMNTLFQRIIEKSILGAVGLFIAWIVWKQNSSLLESSEKKWEANAIAAEKRVEASEKRWEANAVAIEKRVEEAKAETRLFSQIVAANTAQSASTENRLISIEKTVERMRPSRLGE